LYSCKKDPFKQAYLERNSDVVLYPDLTLLTGGGTGDVPRDVYGQEKPIPKATHLVAGTSCKGFSTLRTKYRETIEQLGESGETFLAAVDLLYQEQPKVAILENVVGAPWPKMAAYITGRLVLKDCDVAKGVKGASSGKDKQGTLMFSRDKKNGKIVVEEVPQAYGVRCGSTVQGFISGTSNKVLPVEWPPKKSIRRAPLRNSWATTILSSVMILCSLNDLVHTVVIGPR
jgi:hypothetical protein